MGGRSNIAMGGGGRRGHIGASSREWRGGRHVGSARKTVGAHGRGADVGVTRRAGRAQIVARLRLRLWLLLPVLWNGLVAVAGMVAVLGWRIAHGLLVLPWTSDGLHGLHGHSVGHMRRTGLLRAGLRMSMEGLMRRTLGSDAGGRRLVRRWRALGLKGSSARVVRGAGGRPQVGRGMSSASMVVRRRTGLWSGRNSGSSGSSAGWCERSGWVGGGRLGGGGQA